jgi:hypothetical protein
MIVPDKSLPRKVILGGSLSKKTLDLGSNAARRSNHAIQDHLPLWPGVGRPALPFAGDVCYDALAAAGSDIAGCGPWMMRIN